MSVLKEILEWSQSRDRPAWQRDALRRLVLTGELSADDIRELGEICKSAYGLTGQQDTFPLTRVHIPDDATGSAPVTLLSIFHHRGVNALAEGQTLKFAPGLTLVYGDNAAGKTGYIRILKSACRARGEEKILGNVVSGHTPLTPSVAIKYRVGDDSDVREWTGQGEDDFISRVSVFDTQCSAVYLTEKTDVAYYPLGLDLFDKLVKACQAVPFKPGKRTMCPGFGRFIRGTNASVRRHRRCKNCLRILRPSLHLKPCLDLLVFHRKNNPASIYWSNHFGICRPMIRINWYAN